MDKTKTIENMANYFNNIYRLAINDKSVPDELILILDFGIHNFNLDGTESSWVKGLKYLDSINRNLVEFSKENPEQIERCCILNRKLRMIIDGMKLVMIKDMSVTGWMNYKGQIEPIF